MLGGDVADYSERSYARAQLPSRRSRLPDA
jgi:hypothetical protein